MKLSEIIQATERTKEEKDFLVSTPLSTKMVIVQKLLGKVLTDSKASTKSYSYEYVSLPELLTKLEPILHEMDLYLSFPCQDGQQGCVITDTRRGENISSFFPVPYDGVTVEEEEEKTPQQLNRVRQDTTFLPFQEVGKYMTYYRRYLLLGLLGKQAEKDDDGQSAVNGSTESRKRRRTRKS